MEAEEICSDINAPHHLRESEVDDANLSKHPPAAARTRCFLLLLGRSYLEFAEGSNVPMIRKIQNVVNSAVGRLH